MRRLIYTAICSLDGYVEDSSGSFDWYAPDEEVHGFINDRERPIGTYLYGRRMYETMLFWESVANLEDEPPVIQDFAQIWRSADKIVFSTSLGGPASARTRIERTFDPAAIEHLKLHAETDLSIGGAELASRAFESGLVDELELFVAPITVGAGKPALPRRRLDLELLEERRFESGVVHLRYNVVTP